MWGGKLAARGFVLSWTEFGLTNTVSPILNAQCQTLEYPGTPKASIQRHSMYELCLELKDSAQPSVCFTLHDLVTGMCSGFLHIFIMIRAFYLINMKLCL